MQLYLSSYKIGNTSEKLREIAPSNAKTAYISNAFDAVTNAEARRTYEGEDQKELSDVGCKVDHLDLREYFGKSDELTRLLESYDCIWVSGGNVFVLRKAMQLSGFDEALRTLKDTNMIYGGYSAGVCVLSPDLKGYHFVDDPDVHPYPESQETEWDGLGIIDWWFAPHYQSGHPESADIEQEVAYFQKHNLPYKALADGKVIILDAC